LVFTLLAAACGGGETDTADDASEPAAGDSEVASEPVEGGEAPETVKIAYQGPLTGDNAALGINMLCGIELAVQELNDAGEIPTLEIVELDSQGAPDPAPALANQAAGDPEVLAVVGPAFSGETAAAGPIYEEAGLPFISPSATNPDLSQNGWTNFFRTVATDATQGPVAAKYIAENLGATNVAVIDDSSEYGKGLADIVASSLEEAGATVVFRQGVEAGQQDYSAIVGQVAQSGADAVFYGGYFSDAGLIRKQLVDNGAGDITFVSDDGAFDGGFIEVAGEEAAEGASVTFPGADPLSAPQEFLDAYGEVCDGAAPGAFSIEAYQNTLLIGEALASGATTREAIRQFADDFSGELFGKNIEFTDDGDIAAQTFFIYTVEDGAFVQKEEVSVEAES
jgi:branched-chain amino acid transport system substrate-binding protein